MQAEAIGEKILAAFAEIFQLETYEYPCTPSVGVTLFSPEDRNVDELLKRADLAMYDAKTAGRNGLRFFDPAMQTMISARAALETDLREDLRRKGSCCIISLRLIMKEDCWERRRWPVGRMRKRHGFSERIYPGSGKPGLILPSAPRC